MRSRGSAKPERDWIDEPRFPRSQVEVGSLEWAKVMSFRLDRVWKSKRDFDETWEREWQEVQAGRMWEIWPPEKPYGSPDVLLRELLDVTPEQVEVRLSQRGEHGRGRPQNRLGNAKSISESGTTVTYLRARLARDRPDLLAQLEAGAFKSVRQAAIAAGIVKVPTPLEVIARDWAKLTDVERREHARCVLAWLSSLSSQDLADGDAS